ncbi:hydroxyacylglutathione hydrolase [uncultured Methylophaga sp.]|uniref:hydroxyacylglutathione hydrolase n=1 Tax=uncultured Methylophaga sp. TaxID=285271 RepID=UPI002601A54B|nr:hydroxyacylglutathione hydrolase [uncultured Methylophaga sp.]
MLKVHAVPAFKDNYIWLVQSENSRKVLIVDPGDADPVLQHLKQLELTPAAILITHHHADHVGGVSDLLERYPVPVFGPASETIPALTDPLTETESLMVEPDFPLFKVIDTPGHTPGHICYLTENKLFCGDTLFAGGCGRLLGGTAPALFQSLQKLKQLPADTEIYCAHEYTQANLCFANAVEADSEALQRRIRKVEQLRDAQKATVPSVMSEELATNPFLRSDLPQIKKAAEQYAGRPLLNDEAVFTALRSWKDGF